MKISKCYLLLSIVLIFIAGNSLQKALGQTLSTEDNTTVNVYPQNCGIGISGTDWICVNDDDDNADEKWDFSIESVSGENDTKILTVTGTADKSDATVVIQVISGQDKIDGFWENEDKSGSKISSFVVPAGKSVTKKFYFEGIKHSDDWNDVFVKATLTAPAITINGIQYKACSVEDSHELTVVQAEADVDSKNNNAFDVAGFDDNEDQIEASNDLSTNPGKYIASNDVDFDKDFVYDYIDGTDIPNPAIQNENGEDVVSDSLSGVKFVPIKLVLKKPFDIGKASIKLSGIDMSEPRISENGIRKNEVVESEYKFDSNEYEVEKEGIRVWTRDPQSGIRKKAIVPEGNHVDLNKWISWNDLKDKTFKNYSSDYCEIILYVEYASKIPTALRGAHTLTLEVKEGNVVCQDQININLQPISFHIAPTIETGELSYIGLEGLEDGEEVVFNIVGKETYEATEVVATNVAIHKLKNSISDTREPVGQEVSITASCFNGAIKIGPYKTVVVPGLPAMVTVHGDPAYEGKLRVADGAGDYGVQVNVRDRYDNAVENGTPVSVHYHGNYALRQVGEVPIDEIFGPYGSEERTDAEGKAKFPMKAALGTQTLLTARSGSASPVTFTIDFDGIAGKLTSDKDELIIKDEETATLTLKLDGFIGDNARVDWTVSLTPPGAGLHPASYVSDGVATTTISSKDCPSGECVVTATIGSTLFTQYVKFKGTANLSAFSGLILIGDEKPLFGDPPGTMKNIDIDYKRADSDEVIKLGTASYGGISGKPNTEYEVEFLDERSAELARFYSDVPSAEQGGSKKMGFTTDGDGIGWFNLMSLKEMQSDAFAEPIRYRIKEVENPDESVVGQITCAPIGLAGTAVDCVTSFVGGDPETGAGLAASIAGSVMVVGDAGAYVKNMLRMAGTLEGQPNEAETILAAIGVMISAPSLVATVVTHGAAGPFVFAVKQVVAMGKAIASIARGTGKLSLNIAHFIKRMAWDDVSEASVPSLNRLHDSFNPLVISRSTEDIAALKAMDTFADSQDALRSVIFLRNTYGDDAIKWIVDVSNAGKYEAVHWRSALEVLTRADSGIIGVIKQSGKGKEVLQGLIIASEKGVEQSRILNVLSNKSLFEGSNTITTAYTQVDFILDLSDVCKIATNVRGLDRTLKTMANTGKGKWGFRYELECAAEIARSFPKGTKMDVFDLSNYVRNAEGTTDLDIVVNGIAIQCKRSASAFRNGGQGVRDWVRKALAEPGVTSLQYCVPTGTKIPKAAQAAIDRLIAEGKDIEIVFIPFK